MTSPGKPTILINVTHHDESRGAITGLNFTVDYAEGQSSVTMLEFPPLSDEELRLAFRQKLLDLAKALEATAQSPELILWHPRPRL